MKRIGLGLLSTILLMVTFTLGVYSQADDAGEAILARIEPLLVDIQQRVPVSVTLVIPEGATAGQTVTVPLVLDLNLQIKLADSVTTMTVGETGAGISPAIENGGISARVALPSARMRSAPTTDAEIIATLGEEVHVVLKGITEDGVWVLIQVVDATAAEDGLEGWMAFQLLEITSDAQNVSMLPTITPRPTPTSTPVPTAEETESLAYEDVCTKDASMTDAQLQDYLRSFRGKEVQNWRGWVYEVQESRGRHTVLVAMDPPQLILWSRNIEIVDVPKELALQLSREQEITFSGTIREVGLFWGTVCNPLSIEDSVITTD